MKKTRAIIIILFLISLMAAGIQAQEYGEDKYLYQRVDDLTDHSDWGFNQSIAHNATTDVLELIWNASAAHDFEDFSTYTEVDGDGDLTVNTSHIQWATMRRDAEDWVVFDYGANYFHDLTWEFIIQINDIEAGDATGADIGGFACLSTIAGSVVDQGADDTIMVRARQEGANDDLFRWYLLQRHNGATVVSIIQGLGTNNPMGTYYCRLYRSGTNLTFYAFTDPARTTLNAKLTTNAANGDDSFRYSVAVASIDSASDGADHSSGYFWNEWLGNLTGGYDDSGYIFSVNLLGGDQAALADLFIANISAGDSITVQWSNDNATWTDAEGVAGHETLIDGNSGFELRDLNHSTIYRLLNWTDGGVDSTPQLLQARLVLYNGTAPAGAGTTTVTVTTEEIHWGITIAISLIVGLMVWMWTNADK